MRKVRGSQILRCLLLLPLMLVTHSAWAQLDLAGEWGRAGTDNIRPMGNAGTGDYTGIPYNAAGRLRADTWNATVSQDECSPVSYVVDSNSVVQGDLPVDNPIIMVNRTRWRSVDTGNGEEV